MRGLGIAMAAVVLLASASARSAARKEWVAACKTEIAQLCPGVEPGGGRIAQCLSEKEQQLTKECSEAVRRVRQVSTSRAAAGENPPRKAQRRGNKPAAGPAAPSDLTAVVGLAAALVDLAGSKQQPQAESVPQPAPLNQERPGAEAKPAATP